jgi:hypothetical protein
MSQHSLTPEQNPPTDTIETHCFDRGVALKVVRYHFRRSKAIIRIAVGFFTVRGYNLIRAAATDKRMFILVGVNEPGIVETVNHCSGWLIPKQGHSYASPIA